MGAGLKLEYEKSMVRNIDIFVKVRKKSFEPTRLNSNLIDEFLIIFLAAAKRKGVSSFSNLSELNKKESPRLKLGSKY